MAIFAIIRQPSMTSDRLDAAIVRTYGSAIYQTGPDSWLVSDSGTAVDVANKIKITPDGEAGSALVVEVASYYGRSNPALWSWIKANWEGVPLG